MEIKEIYPMSKRLAYLASEYPAISHTFIFREIQSIRANGLEVLTASIRKPANLDRMTAPEQDEAIQTLYIKTSSLGQVLRAHASICLRSPGGYLNMVRKALRLGRLSFRSQSKAVAYFLEAGILLDWMHRHGLEHVHIHFANPAASVALIASFFGRVSFSLSVHGPDIFYNIQLNALKAKIENSLFVRAISHFCTSQLYSLVDRSHWDTIHIIRCGVDPDQYRPGKQTANSNPCVLCVGRLVPVKGQHLLLKASADLHAAGIEHRLILVGDGPDRKSLQEEAVRLGIERSTLFTGAIGQDEVHSYYDQADLFVLPSFAEGVPVVLMEAMAKEIACISSGITGIPELIEHGQEGFLCAAGDVHGLGEAMSALLQDRDLRIMMGQKGRQKVQALYDLQVNCQKMAELFDSYL